MSKEKETTAVTRSPGGLSVLATLEQQARAVVAAVDQGGGISDTTEASDIALPFVQLIQSLSPQRQKSKPEYIDGAEEGMFFNTVTQELYAGTAGVPFVPLFIDKVWNEWVPRVDGGGFVASYRDKAEAVATCAADHELVDTGVVYALVESRQTGELSLGMLTFTGTKWKAYRTLRALVMRGQHPAQAAYLLTSRERSNDKGTFFVPVVQHLGWLTQEQFDAAVARAKEIQELVRQRVVRFDGSQEAPGSDEDPTDADDRPAF